MKTLPSATDSRPSSRSAAAIRRTMSQSRIGALHEVNDVDIFDQPIEAVLEQAREQREQFGLGIESRHRKGVERHLGSLVPHQLPAARWDQQLRHLDVKIDGDPVHPDRRRLLRAR